MSLKRLGNWKKGGVKAAFFLGFLINRPGI